MDVFHKITRSFWAQCLYLLVISAVIYLPQVSQFGYYRDDWYYIMDGHFGGPKVFHEMFRIDRPARGDFFDYAYSLFGDQALPYHLSQFAWHLAAAIAALWLVRLLWPEQKRFGFCMALLFLIYPGYLWWVAGVEYQPMMASLFLEVLSIALSLKAILTPSMPRKILLFAASALSGLAYLLLVEYAIGMEFFRLLCIFILMQRESRESFWRTAIRSIKAWLAPAAGALGFLAWYILIFESARRATDLGVQLGFLQGSPRLTIQNWIIHSLESLLNTSIAAWLIPFYERFWGLPVRDMLVGLGLAAIVMLLFGLAYAALGRDPEAASEAFKMEALAAGGLGLVAGILPIIIANRRIAFADFSHYGLPLSIAAAMLMTGLLSYLSQPRVKMAAFSGLVGLAALTHFSLATAVAQETATIRAFWWQVTWRVPDLRPGTTLAVYYPGVDIREDFDSVWGPANLIYAPDLPDNQAPIHYELAGMALTYSDVGKVIEGESVQRWKYRTHTMDRDFAQLLVLHQPSAEACVQVVDGRWPILPDSTHPQIRALASHSDADIVLTEAPEAAIPREFLGTEPEHGWCYYYQKVELEGQRGNWEAAVKLADQALELGISPGESLEWLPFLRAYAFAGREDQVKALAALMKTDQFAFPLVCEQLQSPDAKGVRLEAEMQALIEALFCQ